MEQVSAAGAVQKEAERTPTDRPAKCVMEQVAAMKKPLPAIDAVVPGK